MLLSYTSSFVPPPQHAPIIAPKRSPFSESWIKTPVNACIPAATRHAARWESTWHIRRMCWQSAADACAIPTSSSTCLVAFVPSLSLHERTHRHYWLSDWRAWNRLPTELKLLRSTDSFRRDLKTFLFHSVYGHQHTDWLWCALGLLVGGAIQVPQLQLQLRGKELSSHTSSSRAQNRSVDGSHQSPILTGWPMIKSAKFQ